MVERYVSFIDHVGCLEISANGTGFPVQPPSEQASIFQRDGCRVDHQPDAGDGSTHHQGPLRKTDDDLPARRPTCLRKAMTSCRRVRVYGSGATEEARLSGSCGWSWEKSDCGVETKIFVLVQVLVLVEMDCCSRSAIMRLCVPHAMLDSLVVYVVQAKGLHTIASSPQTD